MNFKRLLNTELGRFFISVLLGLGLATLFRKVCKDKSCIAFHGPVISEFDDKIYKTGDKCYKYKAEHAKCDDKKRIIDVSAKEPEHGAATNASFF
jgi:hypothetical protein